MFAWLRRCQCRLLALCIVAYTATPLQSNGVFRRRIVGLSRSLSSKPIVLLRSSDADSEYDTPEVEKRTRGRPRKVETKRKPVTNPRKKKILNEAQILEDQDELVPIASTVVIVRAPEIPAEEIEVSSTKFLNFMKTNILCLILKIDSHLNSRLLRETLW